MSDDRLNDAAKWVEANSAGLTASDVGFAARLITDCETGTRDDFVREAVIDHVSGEELSWDELAEARADAEEATRDALAAIRGRVVLSVRGQGVSERAAAERAGVDRMTVRAWLGKSTGATS